MKWQRTPEWLQLVEKVKTLEKTGLSSEQIAAITNENAHAVKRIIEDEQIADQWARRAFDQKIPKIQRIITLSLTGIEEQLTEMSKSPKLRREMLGTARDVVALGELATKLNTLLRLELGQSTANVSQKVEHTYTKTREVLQKLKKADPIFDFPTLPEQPTEGGAKDGKETE